MAAFNGFNGRRFQWFKGRRRSKLQRLFKGVLKEGCNGSNPISMARGEGDRRRGPTAVAAPFQPNEGERGRAWVGHPGPKGWAKRASSMEKECGHKEVAGRSVNGLQKLFLIFKQGFWILNQMVQILLNWCHTKINLNKLFEDLNSATFPKLTQIFKFKPRL
jgi:hypothetical protein